MFWDLYKYINKDDDIYFATINNGIIDNSGKNNEYRLKLDNSVILPDFFIKNKKLIIEFDGVYYHKNNPENKSREKIRDSHIIMNGYKVFHVDESEYKKDKDEIIKKCLKFIEENN